MVTDWANGACYPSMKSLPDFMNVANGAAIETFVPQTNENGFGIGKCIVAFTRVDIVCRMVIQYLVRRFHWEAQSFVQ